MNTFFARLEGLCPALDGKIVEVMDDDVAPADGCEMLYTVVRLEGKPVTPGALLVDFACLDQIDEPPAESLLATDNPYGKYLEDDRWSVGDSRIEAVATLYEKAAHFHFRHVTTNKTMYDAVLWGDSATEAWTCFRSYQLSPGHEPADFLMFVKEILENENG